METVVLEMVRDAEVPGPVPRRGKVRGAAYTATVNRLITA
jgi:hypothetical protein